MFSESSTHVLYSGTLQIPVCIGSICTPLPSELTTSSNNNNTSSDTQRAGDSASGVANDTNASWSRQPPSSKGLTTHTNPGVHKKHLRRRYCYIRDGSDIQIDAFYRWLLHHTGSDTTTTSSSSPHTGEADAVLPRPRSPSLLYAMLDHVDFIVPKSFPTPRRTVCAPPFMIEDDTWAEHVVEMHLHFLPLLQMQPVILQHRVLLTRRDPNVYPPLLARYYSKTIDEIHRMEAERHRSPRMKRKSTTKTRTHVLHHVAQDDVISSDQAKATDTIISERRDALRVFHPSIHVLHMFRAVLNMSTSSVVQQLQQLFVEMGPHAGSTGEDDGLPWQLPFEEGIADYAQHRSINAHHTLLAVKAALEEEQEELKQRMQHVVQELSADAQRLIGGISSIHDGCLALYARGR